MTVQKTSLFFLLLVINYKQLNSMDESSKKKKLPQQKNLQQTLIATSKEIKKIEITLKLESKTIQQKKINEPYIVNHYFQYNVDGINKISDSEKKEITIITEYK